MLRTLSTRETNPVDRTRGLAFPAPQDVSDCYIEGNIDFIFGDGVTFLPRGILHATAHNPVFLTAQSKHYPDEPSGYVFSIEGPGSPPRRTHLHAKRLTRKQARDIRYVS